MSKFRDWNHRYEGPYSGADSFTLLEICVSDIDGSNRRQLTDNLVGDYSPVWSPDGEQIAFVSEHDNSDEDIYLMHSDGTGVINLTNHSGDDRFPQWSPNGQAIAFISRRDGQLSPNLYIMDTDGSNVTRLTESGNIWSFDWSPDGKFIAFETLSRGSDFTKYGVYVVAIGDGTVIQLLNDRTEYLQAIWLPDGQHIAFMSRREGRYQIYTLNVQTREETQVLDKFNANVMPSWSPDGRFLAYLSGRVTGPNQINLLEVETKTIATFPEFEAPIIMPLVWSPNSKYLLYERIEDWNDDGFGEIKLWALRVEDGVEWAVSTIEKQ